MLVTRRSPALSPDRTSAFRRSRTPVWTVRETIFPSTRTTLIIGPISFVGLMVPHIARLLGLRRPVMQVSGAALLGAAMLVAADWLGRNLLFPYQMPAGLLATFVGGPYFLFLLWRERE
ncbi:iron-hydroxamate transporter permease subunit [Caballeronia sordidicola]|uniref:Iron-hydroxamate transporter permease subunit n=1 Tax=Caballeronia sordidicola TaxID=196367 RepID=A0A158I862_CABSO|nr:iron chelate uptake ABC transporter family permease subunit [Caballeronia sordidicola]SAL52230.1 iron-hydroxamate transporter permease subunit [Caballeronia sordidicola]